MDDKLQTTNGAQPPPGAIQRQEFGGSELAMQAETASTAAAMQARAQVESRYIMALRRPRDLNTVRVLLLAECARPGFADAAIYSKPIGNGVEGPSIRFAEAAARCMTNIYPESATIYDDTTKRIIRAAVTDLEANVTYSKDIVVNKVVERSSLRDGQTALSERTNSKNKKTYLVVASEDELLNKEAALTSKALRQLILRLIPGDILDECMAKCQAILRDKTAKDPGAARKLLADSFASLGVMPGDLKDYLGHSLDTCSPAELADLRKVYSAVKDGEATWLETVEFKRSQATAGATAPPASGAPTAQEQSAAAATVAAAEQAQAKTEPPTPGSDPLADFEAKLRATPPGPERIKLMREVSKMAAHLQGPARDLYNRVTEEEAARG